MSFNDTEFYSAAEVAQKLRINHQVLLRKLQSGEIKGYKLGRDWRITDKHIWEWLEKHSNRNPKPTEREKVIRNYFVDGKLKTIPSKLKRKQIVFECILKNLKPDMAYDEKTINKVIEQFHADYCTVRREMVDLGMMTRDGGDYRVNPKYKYIEDIE